MSRSHRIRIRVTYPSGRGRLCLRAAPAWDRDIEPLVTSADGDTHEFQITCDEPYVYFKPVLVRASERRWSVGENCLALAGSMAPVPVYPYFDEDSHCSACELRELDAGGRLHRLRVFYPPGYHENPLARFPVLYMQDGQNLFFPQEAAYGVHWGISETLTKLDSMSALKRMLVVGVYPGDRERDYTAPGYEAYGRFLVESVKPWIDAHYRSLADASHTMVMGSSLGGVVSFYLAWQYPQVFGQAACLSSTFGWRDDLRMRVATEARRPIRIYLDSGWPRDNYEVTRDMRELLRTRGYTDGLDLHYFAFPDARHDEGHWGMRVHLPLQLLTPRTTPPPAVPGEAAHGRTRHG